MHPLEHTALRFETQNRRWMFDTVVNFKHRNLQGLNTPALVF